MQASPRTPPAAPFLPLNRMKLINIEKSPSHCTLMPAEIISADCSRLSAPGSGCAYVQVALSIQRADLKLGRVLAQAL